MEYEQMQKEIDRLQHENKLLLEFNNKLHVPSDVRTPTKEQIFKEIDRLQHENYIKNKLKAV